MSRSQRPIWLGADARGWDHVRVHLNVLSDGRLGVYEIAAYVGLAAHAESTETGETGASLATLAAYLQCSESRMRTAVNTLSEAGWIGIEPPDALERVKLGVAPRYQLMPPPTPVRGEGVANGTPSPEGSPPSTTAKGPLHEKEGSADCTSLTSQRKKSSESPTSATPDAVRLCDLLADLIEANGSKRPNVTATWLTECDRLMRLDDKTPEKVETAIRWCQADPFWKGVILSMPKLRQKYDHLRLAAKRGRGDSQPANPNASVLEDWRQRRAARG